MKAFLAITALALSSFAFSVMAQEAPRGQSSQATPSAQAAQQGDRAGARPAGISGAARGDAARSAERMSPLQLPDPATRAKLGEPQLCACVIVKDQA